MEVVQEGLTCSVESCTFVAQDHDSLLSHFSRVHRQYKPLGALCFYADKCRHVDPFNTFSGLYKHLKEHHNDFFKAKDQRLEQRDDIQQQGMVLADVDGQLPDHQRDMPMEMEDPVQPTDEPTDDKKAELYGMDPGLFLLRMLEERKLTQVDLQFIMKSTADLMNGAIAAKLDEVERLLLQHGCNHVAVLSSLRENADPLSPWAKCNPFEGLHSQHLQRKYFINNLGLIPPVVKPLEERDGDYGRKRTGKPQKKKVNSFVYIPLLPQLESLLNKEDVYQQVFHPPTPTGDRLHSYRDGRAFKENKLFQQHPNAIQIHFNLDEAQCCDSLGSKTKNNKLMMCYFSIGNLSAKNKSTFKDIQLVSSIKNPLVTSYGLNMLLEPFVNDLIKLENGVDLFINGKTIKVYGTLTAICADNLASHAVGGFFQNFSSSFRKCRYCLATKEEIQTIFTDRLLVPRTVDSHALHCQTLDTPLSKHFSTLYGIRNKSVFDNLEHFKVIGGLVPDIMHDLLEGALPLVICELLLQLIVKDKLFSIEDFNHACQNFDYGYSEVESKPSEITIPHLKKRKLRQSASQIWCLATVMPILVGSLVPIGTPGWICLTLLLEISRSLFQSSISEVEVRLLENMIDEFLTSFRNSFSRRIIPKMHFLVHYPRFILLLGPLGFYWCMRYEAKHSYFKSLARNIGNYINLPLTLSWRHQQWQCKNLSIGRKYHTADVTQSDPEVDYLINMKFSTLFADALNVDLSDNVVIEKLSWVSFNSITYKNKQAFVLCPLHGSYKNKAAFGLISNIVHYQGRYFFLLELYRTLQFDLHFQAVEICKRPDNFFMVLPYDSLLDYRCYHSHKPVHISLDVPNPGRTFITSKTKFVFET